MVQTSVLLALAAFTGLMEASPISRRSGSGKRGLAFPKQFKGQAGSQWTKYFANSQVSWMYDWEAVIDGEAVAGVEYVPLLHSNQDWCTSGWASNVAAARQKYTVENILSFNEPDQVGGGGSNVPVDQAVIAHQKYIQPLASQGLKIGSPAVTNGGEDHKGISYLKNFMAACQGCQFDFVVAHWYGTANADEFISYLKRFHDTFQKPVWVTEFGVNPGQGDANAFLKAVLPFLDSTEWIHRYAYHMAAPDTDGKSYLVNSAGNGLSATGVTYAGF
ncbi:hypothetical protein CC86DRAFT_138871 [Ophiobolus disseminans]|uniref:Asl1-like glycosyl hydrolase catalytic domain-containing protein n=1 Tax=Ophiobolus disseminans TaxID=1469910 RepID=A0A6A7AFP8_9PLEO|nr:hypothetical protein CC86DRAFT_138871 [Ophiobolus disseminans]